MTREGLPVLHIGGDPASCGQAYGEALRDQMVGYYYRLRSAEARKLAFAQRCWPYLQRQAPISARFMQGMARGSGMPIQQIVTLTLYEELAHQPHCTALVATGEATRGGHAVVGMNWDAGPDAFAWPGLLRLEMRHQPRLLAYHFPGLWVSAGINECGLAIGWTSTGMSPMVPPRPGVPTHVLLAELLREPDVSAALDRMQQMRHAGPFILLLADAAGHTAVIEASSHQLHIERNCASACRANHYACAPLQRATRQKLRRDGNAYSRYRERRMADMLQQFHGHITPAAAGRMLTDRQGKRPWVHQLPPGTATAAPSMMTIDSLVMECARRELWTCRGGRIPGPWQKLGF